MELQKEEGGVNKSLPLSFSRQLRSVLERLRAEIIDLATQRAIAFSQMPGNGFAEPSLLAPNTATMQAKLKWKRSGKKIPDALNSQELVREVERLDRKLKATQDEVNIIVTLCQEVTIVINLQSILLQKITS